MNGQGNGHEDQNQLQNGGQDGGQNELQNAPPEVGMVMLVVTKPDYNLTHAVRNLNPWEVRAVLQKMLEIAERTIIQLQAQEIAAESTPGPPPSRQQRRLLDRLRAKGVTP